MANKRMQDADHLRTNAYSDASKLNARIAFWQLYGEPRDSAFKRYFDRYKMSRNAKVLDLGCGPAHCWQWGLENGRVSEDWSVTLTDLSPGMIAEAKCNITRQKRQFTFEIADVCNLNFEEASYDAVTANYMLYHASDQDMALAEISRVLKPGAWLYAATNSEGHIAEFLNLQRQFIVDETELPNIGLAHAAFTLENGKAMIERYFSNVEVIRDDSICEATDPKIVVDYALSMDADLDVERVASAVKAEIADKGYFRITRSTGMFIAQK